MLAQVTRRNNNLKQVEESDMSDIADRVKKIVIEHLGVDARSIPTTGWSPRNSARSTSSSCYGMAAADQAIKDAGWTPSDTEARAPRAA
jgi:3-oxoacyl-(acyl-carrier-protein) synthase